MGVIAGQRTTSHQSAESRNKRDVKDDINQLEPDQYPLVAVMNKAKNRLQPCGNYKFEWLQDALLPRFDALATAITDGTDDHMHVVNGAYFRKGDVVRVNRDELVLVTATPEADEVAISRGFGNTAKGAAVDSQLHIIANISDEGETIGDILSTQKVPMFNYVTLHKTPYKVSGSANASDTYGKGDLDYEVAKAIIEHGKSIELTNILGQLKLVTVGKKRLTFSAGLLSLIASNVKDMGGTMDEDELEDIVRRVFRYGSKSKLCFGSSKFCTVVNSFGREKLITKQDDSTYGVTMTEYKNTGRKLNIVEHPLLENESLTDLTGLAGEAIIIDPADLSFRHLRGRYMVKKQVGESSDSTLFDGTVGQILTEGGLQLEQEKKHGLITGVTG